MQARTRLLTQARQGVTYSLCHVTSQTRADWSVSSSGCQSPFSSALVPPALSVHAPRIGYTHKTQTCQQIVISWHI